MSQYEAVISFVLYRTQDSEIRSAVDQVLSSARNYHVALVDNSLPELNLKSFDDPRITIIRPGANLGYGAGHNLALRRFAGLTRYHFVLNTDLSFTPTAIAEMISFMDARPDVGLSMPLVNYPDGKRQHLCRLLPRPIDILARAFFPDQRWAKTLNRRYELHDWAYDAPLSIPFLSGCFMALRAEALAQAGLFDERFFMFAEDLDLSRRLHRISRTVLCPEVSVVHQYRTKAQRSSLLRSYLIRSFISYFNKYGWIFDRERTQMNRRALDAVKRSSALGGEW